MKDRSRFSKSRAGTDRKAKLAKKRSERSSRTTTRCTPRDLLSASIPLANPLAIWEEPTRAARHRGEIGREAGALSLSASASLPPPPLLSRRRCHKVTRSLGSAGFTRAGVRTFDRSVGRSWFSPMRNVAPIDDRDFARTLTHVHTRAAKLKFYHSIQSKFDHQFNDLQRLRCRSTDLKRHPHTRFRDYCD